MNTVEFATLIFMVSSTALVLGHVAALVSNKRAVSRLSQMEDGIQKFLKPFGYHMYKVVPPDRTSASEIQFTLVPGARIGLSARLFLRLFMNAYLERPKPYRSGVRAFNRLHSLNERCQSLNSEFLARRAYLHS